MQENYAKISKIKQLEAIGARWATMGHLEVPPGPTMALAGVALQVPPHQSMGNGQETHPKPSPPLIPSRCMIKGRKEASHGLLTHHPVCRVLKWTNGVHTHTLLHPKCVSLHMSDGEAMEWLRGAGRRR